MHKRFCIAFILLLVFFCGCRHQEAGKKSGVVELSFWNGFTGPDGAMMEQIVKRFNREHPGIRVRMQMIPWGTYYDKVTLGLAYGGAPDVFIVHVNRFPEFAHYGSLEPIDDLIKTGRLDTKDIIPTAWNACRFQGKHYSVPLDCHPLGLYYNVRLFREAGIVDAGGNPKPPTNLQEFLSAARKLTKDRNGDGKPDQWGLAYTWLRTNSYAFLNQHNAGILDSSLKHSGLTNPEAVRAMKLMQDIIYKYKVCPPPEGQDAWMGFQTGKVAMAMEGIYMIASLESQKDLQFAGAPIPRFGPKMATWAGTHLMVMPRGIAPERRKAAWEFMCFLSDNSLEWAKGGQIPVRNSILASPAFKKLPVQYQFSRQLPYIVYEPASISNNQMAPFADAAFEAVLNRSQPVETALEEAARRMNKVVARE